MYVFFFISWSHSSHLIMNEIGHLVLINTTVYVHSLYSLNVPVGHQILSSQYSLTKECYYHHFPSVISSVYTMKYLSVNHVSFYIVNLPSILVIQILFMYIDDHILWNLLNPTWVYIHWHM